MAGEVVKQMTNEQTTNKQRTTNKDEQTRTNNQLLLGKYFKMRVQDSNSNVYNCPLSW